MNDECHVNTLKWWKRALVGIFVKILKLYWASLRIDLSPRMEEIIAKMESPSVVAFWHNNLFVASPLNKLLENKFKMYGLVSPSRDGAWLAEIFCKFGIKTIRGSTKKRGISAITQMTEVLKNGALVTITPDGPRGPLYKFKSGVALVAKSCSANVILVAIKQKKCFRLSSWDRFKVPLPFSKIEIDAKSFDYFSIKNLSAEDLTIFLEKELKDLQSALDAD